MLSPTVPIASLTFTGRVIIFPDFELEFVPKPPPSRAPHKRHVPAEDNMQKKEEVLSPPRQSKRGPLSLAELPSFEDCNLTRDKSPQLWKTIMENRKKPLSGWLPVVPDNSPRKGQQVTSQPRGKPMPNSQASQQSPAQALKPQWCKQGEQERKKVPVGIKLPSVRCEARMPEKPPAYKVFIPQPLTLEVAQLLKSRPETFWSVLKEPQKTVLAGYSFEPSLLVPPMYEESRSTQCHPLKARSAVSRMEWPWLE
ncbi:uncharacterized protein LOC122153548 [Tyto alba]|uniref:uncharacterized protein LOC116961447 n=1 Tax=Tyto alba TaxID=56313 RepID=UPI00140308E0|nr:uncharacterized protein LOC116961447 [Tyto alba]XP_042649896.1 uncharacterized protein LOC122153548 [Tyto alba]